MAGVVAMASVIEDFDTQPCKKSRKDGGSPVVKTITNYFSPVAKPVEKPFSPPRSNNIMDYFTRKPPSSKEKTSPSQVSKENCRTPQSTEKHPSPEAAVRQPKKRGRKVTKAARKLVEPENASLTATGSCLISDEPYQNKDMSTETISGCGLLGNDTVPLTSEKNATLTVIDLTEKDEQHKQSCHSGKPQAELMGIPSSSNVREKKKLVKTVACSSKKNLQGHVKQLEPEEEEETSLCDISMKDNDDGASEANNSTVTISFEEFLRSQGKDDDEEGSKITTDAEEMDRDPLKNVGSGEPVLQVSPRLVTIQAEIHKVSPKQEAVKGVGKLPSIFNKRKGALSSVDAVPSPQTEVGRQSSSSLLIVKRKSNVVLQEEDLELAVLGSETTPKCSETERKQFMAAFKQPSQDGSKTKPGKNRGKQNQPGEKNLDPAENVVEEDCVNPPAVEQVPATSQESSVAKKRPTRKGKKKAKEEDETITSLVAASPLAEEVGVIVIDVGDKEDEPIIPAVRKSRRGAVARQAPDTSTDIPVRTRTRRQKKSMDDVDDDDPALLDCHENMSTPKTRRSKHGVFVAEIVGPPDINESPIRIKFTRVHRNVSTSKAGSESGINTPKASKTSDKESKKRMQAKKLVEKAKVIKQSKKTFAENRSPLRRSSRHEASIKKSYCENEDSVICLEDDQSATSPLKATEKRKTQKPLRSLNDVLGKTVKETKAVPGSKAAMLGPEKSASKVSTVISIFDDSSREGSENSQDDEQFKARREFLKSGLPESFRKQIAKTTATKEAHSLPCSSLQPVIHIKQSQNDCPLWTLPWPESSLLCPLKELWSPSSSFSFVYGSLESKTEPAQRVFCERGSGWRPEISDSVRQLLIEEISKSNPPFPAQMFITRFLKRRADHQQHGCTASETTPLAGGKRKRMDDGGGNALKVAKKQRGNHSDENVSKPEPTKRGGHTRRVKRFKPEEAKDKVRPSDISAPILHDDESVVVLDDVLLVKDTVDKDMMKEDVLWTERYQPQHSSDIIGNTASVRRLHSWLKEWKLRADREERKKQKDKKQEEGSNDSDWDCGEEDSQDAEDMLCNTMLITGPTGVGKTAAVYACAQELGFKVFEVNASSQRSGRLILSQLREATQSHQVDSQGVNAHKPTYFNSYGSAGTTRPGFSPRKVNSPRRVVSSPRKHPQSPRGAKRGTLAPTSLVNFFKMSQPTSKDPHKAKKNEQAAAPKRANNESANKQEDKNTVKSAATASTPEGSSEEQSKKTATSLILFEEVDVIFDEDSGFLAAIKTFMATTKRPVILTTSDPAFSTMFDGNFEEIHFKTPSVLNVCTYLQLLCLAEDTRTDPANISSLLRLNGCDIRQCLLQLQFWTRSSGGHYDTKPVKHPDTNSELKPEPDGEAAEVSVCAVTVPHTLPPCDTGCTESRLGLLNLEPERDIWKLFRSQSLKEAVCWELLINSRQRGVDLLYTNMETLLPLPLTQLTSSTCRPVSETKDHPSDIPKEQSSLDMVPSHTRLLHMPESGDCSDDGSPVKVSNRMRRNKTRHCLPVQDGLHSDSDSEEGFLSLCKPQGSAQGTEKVSKRLVPEKVERKPLTAEERVKSLPVSQCLESIADFFDNMSYLDSSLLMYPEGGASHRRTPAVSAVFKDGMTDELRVEADRGSWGSGERVLQIQAAVEALSFHKCRSSVADAWDKSQQLEGELGKEATEELTLPVASHCEGYSFSQDGPCQLQLVQRRREVMESLVLRGVVGVGNRPAAALDYLPVLRTICRSELLKEKGKVKRRFLHYLDAIHLGLDKSTVQHLAEDFP